MRRALCPTISGTCPPESSWRERVAMPSSTARGTSTRSSPKPRLRPTSPCSRPSLIRFESLREFGTHVRSGAPAELVRDDAPRAVCATRRGGERHWRPHGRGCTRTRQGVLRSMRPRGSRRLCRPYPGGRLESNVIKVRAVSDATFLTVASLTLGERPPTRRADIRPRSPYGASNRTAEGVFPAVPPPLRV